MGESSRTVIFVGRNVTKVKTKTLKSMMGDKDREKNEGR